MGAPLNPVPQVLRVFLEGLVDNNDVYKWGNVLHYHYTGTAPDNSSCAAYATLVALQWSISMAPECPSPTHLTKVTVTDLTSLTAGEGEWTGDYPGTRGDDSIPANAAMLISYLAPSRYKGGHPRTYLYVGGNADLDGAALWSSAFTAEVQTHWLDFFANTVGEGWGSGTANSVGFVRYRGKYLPNGGPPLYYLDTPEYFAYGTATAQQEMASQRRRIGRRKA